MIRAFFAVCICLVLGAFLYQEISSGSGYILISLGDTRVEMSFWMGVFLLLASSITLIVVYVLGRVLLRLIFTGTVQVARIGRFQRGEKFAQRQTARGLIEFIEGNWKQARKHLLSAAKRTEFPMINYLAAARSTYELGNDEEALDLLHKAETSSADSGLAVALTQARMLLVNKKYEQCLANLERAKKIAPQHPVVLELLQQTYVLLQDWKSLKALIPELRKSKIMSAKDFMQLEKTLYSDLLKQAGEKARRQSPEEAFATLAGEWDGFPTDVRKQVEIIESYISLLAENNNEQKAESLLRKELNRQWDDRLVVSYGRLEGRDAKKQLVIAESWLKGRPGSDSLLLTLGRLCLRNHRWAEAHEYFDGSLKLKNNPETYAELARLLAHMGDHKLSTDYYQRGLLMTTKALPNLPMPASTEFGGSDNPTESSSTSLKTQAASSSESTTVQ